MKLSLLWRVQVVNEDCQVSEEDLSLSGWVREVQKFTPRRKALEKALKSGWDTEDQRQPFPGRKTTGCGGSGSGERKSDKCMSSWVVTDHETLKVTKTEGMSPKLMFK